jgi:hypothetical protein
MSSCCCCDFIFRKGFAHLIEYSERGEFSVDDTIELEIPSSSDDHNKIGWLDIKIGIAINWSPTFCMLQKGHLELYSKEVQKSNVANKGIQH